MKILAFTLSSTLLTLSLYAAGSGQNPDTWQEGSENSWGEGYEDTWQWGEDYSWPSSGEEGQGQWGSIGIELSFNGYGFEIGHVEQYSPAYEAGLAAGDWLYFIDGNDVSNWSLEQIYNALYGEAGSYVEIGIQRWGAERSFFVERQANY